MRTAVFHTHVRLYQPWSQGPCGCGHYTSNVHAQPCTRHVRLSRKLHIDDVIACSHRTIHTDSSSLAAPVLPGVHGVWSYSRGSECNGHGEPWQGFESSTAANKLNMKQKRRSAPHSFLYTVPVCHSSQNVLDLCMHGCRCSFAPAALAHDVPSLGSSDDSDVDRGEAFTPSSN